MRDRFCDDYARKFPRLPGTSAQVLRRCAEYSLRATTRLHPRSRPADRGLRHSRLRDHPRAGRIRGRNGLPSGPARLGLGRGFRANGRALGRQVPSASYPWAAQPLNHTAPDRPQLFPGRWLAENAAHANDAGVKTPACCVAIVYVEWARSAPGTPPAQRLR